MSAVLGLCVGCGPGSFDTSFGGTGTVSLGDPGGTAPQAEYLGFEDGVAVSGRTNQQLVLVTASGQIDPAWGAGVPATIVSDVSVIGEVPINGVSEGVLVSGLDAQSHARLMRFTREGVLDSTFGDGGIVTIADPASTEDVSVEAKPNGFVAGPAGDGYIGFLGTVHAPALYSGAYVDVVRLSATGAELSRQRLHLPNVRLGGSSRTSATSPVKDVFGVSTVVALNAEWVGINTPETPPGYVFRQSWLARFRDSDGTLDTTYGLSGFQAIQNPPQLEAGSVCSNIVRQVIPINWGVARGVATVGQLNYVLPGPPSELHTSLGSFISFHGASGEPSGVNGGYLYSLSTSNPSWFEPTSIAEGVKSLAASESVLVGGTRHESGGDVGVVASYRLDGTPTANFGNNGFASVPGIPTSLSLRTPYRHLYVGSLIADIGPAVSRLFAATSPAPLK